MSNLPRPSKDTGWRLFVRTMVARAYPRVIGQQRQRWWMFFEVTLPLVGLSAYVFVYRAIGAPADFVGFVILGGAMSAFCLENGVLVGSGFDVDAGLEADVGGAQDFVL